jgi:pilus assembly protein Flp/PilA
MSAQLPADRRDERAIYSGDGEMKKIVMQLVRDEQGQDLIEYGLLIGIITVGAIAAIIAIGPKVANYFSTLNSNLP